MKELCTGRILYSRISIVLQYGPTSNGGGGPILILCYWPEVGLYSETWMGGWASVSWSSCYLENVDAFLQVFCDSNFFLKYIHTSDNALPLIFSTWVVT